MSFKLLPLQLRAISVLKWYLTDNSGMQVFKKKNPHLDKEYVKAIKKLSIPCNIATGRTTTLAFAYLDIAIKRPYSKVYPREIVNAFTPPSFIRDDYLMNAIRQLWETHFKKLNPDLELMIYRVDRSIEIHRSKQ